MLVNGNITKWCEWIVCKVSNDGAALEVFRVPEASARSITIDQSSGLDWLTKRQGNLTGIAATVREIASLFYFEEPIRWTCKTKFMYMITWAFHYVQRARRFLHTQ
jgi:hypothetical protein